MLKTLFSLSLVGFVLMACGPVPFDDGDDRLSMNKLDTDFTYQEGDALFWANGVDFLESEMSACAWHTRLEWAYTPRVNVGRFRMLGEVSVKEKPSTKVWSPFAIIKALAGVIDFILPWDIFRIDSDENSNVVPWGRIDPKANVIHSYALLSQAEAQIPSREEFLKKAEEKLVKTPISYSKWMAFKTALRTGVIKYENIRETAIQEELEIVFPGLFSADEQHDLSQSLNWILIQNGLGHKHNYTVSDLWPYTRKLPVFRGGGWDAFSEDMTQGLMAAVKGLNSKSARERACASNIIFRSTEQMLQLMGQETIPLYDSPKEQSYTPSLTHLMSGVESLKMSRCSSDGSLLRAGRHIRVDEKQLANLSQHKDSLSWASQPTAMRYCKPEASSHARKGQAQSSNDLSSMLNRVEAFSHYLFLMNPAASWWQNSSRPHALGDFGAMENIYKSQSLAPPQVHMLALAFLQLDLLHLQDGHLVFIDKNNQRTFDQNEALGIRLSEKRIGPDAHTVETSLDSALKLFELLTKFERYLGSLEAWSTSPKATQARVKQLFDSKENLQMIIGEDGNKSIDTIEQLYTAMTLLLLKFVDHSELGSCHKTLVSDLTNGVDEAVGDCGDSRFALAKAFAKLSSKYKSPLLFEHSQALSE